MHERHEMPEISPALQVPEVTPTKNEVPAPGVVDGALGEMQKEDIKDRKRNKIIERIKQGWLN